MKYGFKKLYIDGELVESTVHKKFNVICPGTEEAVAQIAWAGKEDTSRALTAAQKGFLYWSSLELGERAQWMLKLRDKMLENRDLLRTSIMDEMGKVWEGTDEDLTSITDSLGYYAEEIQKTSDISIPDKEGTHEHKVIHQPLGVVVAFLAYNFPLLNLGFKLGPALAAGCSIILKPSEFSPLSAYLIGEICAEIGFPAGVINILCGDIPDVGVPLCQSTIPRLITLIGSTQTAQKLIQQSSQTSLKRYSMECGGNAPFIVFDDAGLASYVHTRDEARLDFFSEHLEFGEVQLNGVKYDIYLPHGGIKNSGMGVDCSPFALDDYLIKKRITKALF